MITYKGYVTIAADVCMGVSANKKGSVHYGGFNRRRFGNCRVCDFRAKIGVVGMAIKDKWVFQKRETEKPWAFLLVKEYDKSQGRTAECIDYTFYHEDVQNVEHCISEVCVKYDSVTGYVDHLLAVVNEYSAIYSQDKVQLTRELTALLLS